MPMILALPTFVRSSMEQRKRRARMGRTLANKLNVRDIEVLNQPSIQLEQNPFRHMNLIPLQPLPRWLGVTLRISDFICCGALRRHHCGPTDERWKKFG